MRAVRKMMIVLRRLSCEHTYASCLSAMVRDAVAQLRRHWPERLPCSGNDHHVAHINVQLALHASVTSETRLRWCRHVRTLNIAELTYCPPATARCLKVGPRGSTHLATACTLCYHSIIRAVCQQMQTIVQVRLLTCRAYEQNLSRPIQMNMTYENHDWIYP